MNKDEAIEIIKDLKNYVIENWDPEEYKDDIEKNSDALDLAINALQEGKIAGYMKLNGKKYLVLEQGL